MIEQREFELANQKEITESLLLNILPVSIAIRMKNNEQVIADTFPVVTVVFANMAGFTSIASIISPRNLAKKFRPHDRKTFFSDQLRNFVPIGGTFGLDVIVEVGLALFGIFLKFDHPVYENDTSPFGKGGQRTFFRVFRVFRGLKVFSR